MSFASQTSQTGSPASSSGLLRGGPLVAGVEVSVVVSETHSLTSNATKISLESGAQVTDHVIVNPDDVSVVFAMTNAGDDSANAARDAFETFKRMRDDRELLDLTTEHHAYQNMVITSVSPLHQAPYKGALSVSLHLQQINFVSLQSVGREPGKLKGTAAKTGSAPVDAGKQEPKKLEGTLLQKMVEAWKRRNSGGGNAG